MTFLAAQTTSVHDLPRILGSSASRDALFRQVPASFILAPLVILGNVPYLSVFKTEQLQALAYMSFKFYVQTYRIALVLFGFFCLLIGYLIFKSDFLPRILGVLIALAGLGWLTFLSQPFGAKYFPNLWLPEPSAKARWPCGSSWSA